MNFIAAIFRGALSVAGFVEKEISNIVGVGQFVRGLNLPPATHPGVYADVLKAVGFAENEVSKVQVAGQEVAVYAGMVAELEAKVNELRQGQTISGTVDLFGQAWAYNLTPEVKPATVPRL